MKTRYETTQNVKKNEVLDCPNHRDKICILRRLKKVKDSSSLVKSLKSETDNGLSSCSNFPERTTLEETEIDKPVLPELKHLRGKVTDDQLEAIKDVLERNEDVFSKHKAVIGSCNFVEHEIELEESEVPHREGARRMAPHKSDASRKEIETILEYGMIEPSKSPWACGVVIAKPETDGGLPSCSNFPKRPTLEEMEIDKPVLPEIKHLRGKVTDDQLEAIKDVLERNEDVILKHKADIGCCNFVKHEIELEESAVPHREGARRMTPHKFDAC